MDLIEKMSTKKSAESVDLSNHNHHDDRGTKKRDYLKNTKWMRQIKIEQPQNQSNILIDNKNETKDSEDNIRNNSRKYRNTISNPKKIQSRSRTESPPPKSKRSNQGINRGKPGGCSICRPKIHKRMHQTAGIRSDVRKIKNDQMEFSVYELLDRWNNNDEDLESIGTSSGSE